MSVPLQRTAELDEPSDAELLADVRSGHLESYGLLYRRHAGSARALARHLSGSPAEADDLVAEAFAKVLDMLRTGGGPDAAFRAYLLTTLRHTLYDRARRDRRVELSDDMTRHDPGVPWEDTAVAGLDTTLAARAFNRLPERWQTVLWHTEIEQETPAEVAPLLGLTPNGVAALAYRAREGLRQAYLQEHVADGVSELHRTTVERLGAWARGGLSRRQRVLVDQHLANCPQCRRLAAELTDVNGSLRGVVAPLVLGSGAAAYLASHGGTGAGAGAAAAGTTTAAGTSAAGGEAAGVATAGTGAGTAAGTGAGTAAGTSAGTAAGSAAATAAGTTAGTTAATTAGSTAATSAMTSAMTAAGTTAGTTAGTAAAAATAAGTTAGTAAAGTAAVAATAAAGTAATTGGSVVGAVTALIAATSAGHAAVAAAAAVVIGGTAVIATEAASPPVGTAAVAATSTDQDAGGKSGAKKGPPSEHAGGGGRSTGAPVDPTPSPEPSPGPSPDPTAGPSGGPSAGGSSAAGTGSGSSSASGSPTGAPSGSASPTASLGDTGLDGTGPGGGGPPSGRGRPTPSPAPITGPELSADPAVVVVPPRRGGSGELEVPVHNTGDGPATGMVATVRLPDGFAVQPAGSGQGASWRCTGIGTLGTCQLTSLAAHTDGRIRITVWVAVDAPPDGPVFGTISSNDGAGTDIPPATVGVLPA